jgi:hypothetical protein
MQHRNHKAARGGDAKGGQGGERAPSQERKVSQSVTHDTKSLCGTQNTEQKHKTRYETQVAPFGEKGEARRGSRRCTGGIQRFTPESRIRAATIVCYTQ